MNYQSKQLSLLAALLFLSACSSVPETPKKTLRKMASSESEVALVQTLPKLTSDDGELLSEIKRALKNRTKGKTDEELTAAATKLRDYLLFLGLSAKDLKKAEAEVIEGEEASSVKKKTNDKAKDKLFDLPEQSQQSASDDNDTGGEEEDKTPSNLRAVLRLFIASTQFLDCPSMVDWECLEKTPTFKPTADFRIERSDLSSPVHAGDSLDMDVYFTEGWDKSAPSGVAQRFAEKIQKDAQKSLSIAMYGIDDIKGSMSGVYQSILDRAKSNETKVRAVVDVMGVERSETPWVFSYVDRPEYADKYIFGSSKNPETPENMHLTFQYDGTPHFIRELNEGITSDEESRVRIEWSFPKIMHNKFAVMEKDNGDKAVWTGTANISKNCMGVEANANMSVYIRNNAIADAFLDQFNLMFDFDKGLAVKSKLVTQVSENEPSLAGRFHRSKYPVNKRLFTFQDGTKVRVHFAPTDDAEHRVILPMLLSAKEGDEIRISMFGGTGYEIVRAMQYAVAKGANVRIAFDRRLGHGLSSWIRDAILNVNMPNPYIGKVGSDITPGKISYRVSTWTGKNHYKAGTLTRKRADGSMHAEQIIVGSQNWSSGGNDYNDENLISIQNLEKNVKAAELFNKEFDTRLWVKSKEEKPLPPKRL